jgi:2-polyprenyl-3-methyl-5-hydroxy-6-metoxy-1,4-benzoquinol methylase
MEEKNIFTGSNKFWKEYSEREDLSLNSLMNLEIDPQKSIEKFTFEKARLESIITYNSSWNIVDLGGGVGLWSEYFSDKVKGVTLVEREKRFVELAKERIKKENVSVVLSDVSEFDDVENKFDAVFISGVTLYLTDDRLNMMMKKIKKYMKPNGLFIHRDAYGIDERFLLDRKNSENLKLDYSAVYRSRNEYDEIFVKEHGFEKTFDEDMYPNETQLNKRKETRLRIAIYKNRK